MFRRDDDHAIGARDLVLEARHFGRQVAFVILVVHWQIVDAHEFGIELSAPSLTSAWASLRLIESRRLLPTITATRGLGVAWLNTSVRNRN